MSLDDLFMGDSLPKPAGLGSYSGMFKPIDSKAVHLRLIPGDYPHPSKTNQQLYFQVKHWNNQKKRSHYCTSTWVMTQQGRLERKPGSKCIGCHLSIDEQKRYVSTSTTHGCTVLVLDDFHLYPFKSDKKTPLGLNDEGSQKFRKVLCEGDKCEYCKGKYKTTWGRKVRWDLGMGYLETLRGFAKSKRDICANCGSKPHRKTGEGGILIALLTCPHCGNTITPKSQKMARILAEGPSVCDKCGTTVTMEEEILCSDCADPKRTTIFDMDIWVQRTGKQPNYTLNVVDYDICAPDEEGWKSFSEEPLKPLNLVDIMMGPPLMAQCRMHEVANPWEDMAEDYE